MTAPPAPLILAIYTTRQQSLSQNVSLLASVRRMTYFIVIEAKSGVASFVPKLTLITLLINNTPHKL